MKRIDALVKLRDVIDEAVSAVVVAQDHARPLDIDMNQKLGFIADDLAEVSEWANDLIAEIEDAQERLDAKTGGA